MSELISSPSTMPAPSTNGGGSPFTMAGGQGTSVPEMEYPRRWTRPVRVGPHTIGGMAPVLVQSMITEDTRNIEGAVRQVIQLYEAGCELVRVTAPSLRDAQAIGEIKAELDRRGVPVPLVADVHRMLEEAVACDATHGPALQGLGELAMAESDWAEAEKCFRAVLDRQKRAGGGRPLAATVHTLGEIRRERGDLDGALILFQKAYKLGSEKKRKVKNVTV